MKWRAFFIGATDFAGVFSVIAGCKVPLAPATQISRVSDVVYESRDAKMRFSYPVTWHSVPGETTLTLEPIGQPVIELCNVVVDYPALPMHFPGMINLNAVQFGFVADLRSRYNKVKVTASDAILAGEPSRRLTAIAEHKEGAVDVNVILCVRNDAVYVIDSEADVADEPAAKAAMDMIVKSWKWLE
jgi:hypothetical protein